MSNFLKLLAISGFILFSLFCAVKENTFFYAATGSQIFGIEKTQDNLSGFAEFSPNLPASPGEIAILTAYTLSADETDTLPATGAYNDDLRALRAKGIKVCASNRYPRGARLKIGEIECEVYDRMAKKYSDRIDLLMDTKEEAKNWGIKRLPVKLIN